jgi:hypothetical protein
MAFFFNFCDYKIDTYTHVALLKFKKMHLNSEPAVVIVGLRKHHQLKINYFSLFYESNS